MANKRQHSGGDCTANTRARREGGRKGCFEMPAKLHRAARNQQIPKSLQFALTVCETVSELGAGGNQHERYQLRHGTSRHGEAGSCPGVSLAGQGCFERNGALGPNHVECGRAARERLRVIPEVTREEGCECSA